MHYLLRELAIQYNVVEYNLYLSIVSRLLGIVNTVDVNKLSHMAVSVIIHKNNARRDLLVRFVNKHFRLCGTHTHIHIYDQLFGALRIPISDIVFSCPPNSYWVYIYKPTNVGLLMMLNAELLDTACMFNDGKFYNFSSPVLQLLYKKLAARGDFQLILYLFI